MRNNHKYFRVTWSREIKIVVLEDNVSVCFLEKVLLYHWVPNRAQSLTFAPYNPVGIYHLNTPQVLICSFTIKVVFMGVIARTLSEIGFDGGIFRKIISEKKVRKNTSYN